MSRASRWPLVLIISAYALCYGLMGLILYLTMDGAQRRDAAYAEMRDRLSDCRATLAAREDNK